MRLILYILKLFGIYFLFFNLIGCGGMRQPAHPIDHYTLEYQLSGTNNPVSLPVVLQVQKFQISPEYNTNSIIYREDPLKRNHYAYHKWRANPSDLVTYFITRDLNQSSLFAAVVTPKSRLIPTHVLEGTVNDFYEKDLEDTWQAILTVHITLLSNSESDSIQRIELQKTYSGTELCAMKNPQALAEAMSRNMAAISEQIIDDIYTRLSKESDIKNEE